MRRTLIDTYVADVAKQLPRRQRADVAAELRTILLDELGDRTQPVDAHRVVDAFGRPDEAAARGARPGRLEILALMIASLVLYAVFIANGRWNSLTRRIAIGLNLVLAGALTWVLTTGRVFTESRADELRWVVLAGILLVVAVDVTQKVRRERR